MAETPTYNYGDIQRYLQQQMTRQEMHDFERALMDDPFLADAMEGFATGNTTVAETHLQEIEREITGEKQEAKVVMLQQRQTHRWKAAAVAAIVAGVAIISYSVLRKNTADVLLPQNEAAVAKETAPVPRQDTVSIAREPLPGSVNGSASATPPITASIKPLGKLKPLPVSDAIASAPLVYDSASLLNSNSITAESMAVARVAAAPNEIIMMARKAPVQTDTAMGLVVDETGRPIPFATVRATNDSAATTTDAFGKFSLQNTGRIAGLKISAPGYDTAQVPGKDLADNRIVLHRNSSALGEVVVTGYSTNRKAKLTMSDTTAAEPVGGWKAFERYVVGKIEGLKDAATPQQFEHPVIVEFYVDNEGHPTNITTLSEPDPQTGEKVVEIINDGPRWKKKTKSKKVKVVIPF